MKRTMTLIAVSLAVAACASLGYKDEPTQPVASIHPSQIGLSKVSVDEVAAPILFQWATNEPGEVERPQRPYAMFPPVIPHGIEDALPISRDENACMDCHAEADEDTIAIPESHYVDYRNAPGGPGEAVYGARYNCNACHVPQSGVQPLVDNPFSR